MRKFPDFFSKIKALLLRRVAVLFFLALLVLNVLLLAFWLQKKQSPPPISGISAAGQNEYPEIKELENRQMSFKELSDYFQALAEQKGGRYAYAVLRIAPIPPNTDMHLMGHIVGDVLYKQEGLEGIHICTQDFRNACSHSIVVGLFLEQGEAALPEISQACRNAPGGSGAYTMCFHGLGHGILAYTGYDMPKAVELCQKTGTEEFRRREAVECIGGTVMEIIGGGFHNPDLWEAQSKKYLPASDPLAPCTSAYMPKEAKGQCYTYLTPRLFKVAGGDLGHLLPADFEKAFPLCDAMPSSDAEHRTTCYGGFGKEFVVLARNRDIRDINTITEAELANVYTWCNLARDKEGITSCIGNALSSLFWGGENDRKIAIRFCGLIGELPQQDSCFRDLIGIVTFYIKDQAYLKAFCEELPLSHQKSCQGRITP